MSGMSACIFMFSRFLVFYVMTGFEGHHPVPSQAVKAYKTTETFNRGPRGLTLTNLSEVEGIKATRDLLIKIGQAI